MRESKQRLEAQRQEYEGAIARHQVAQQQYSRVETFLFQSFIDQLIEDKKSISQKCESLTVSIVSIWSKHPSEPFLPIPTPHLSSTQPTQVEMRTAERRSKENTKAMESRHNLEMSRIKQVFSKYS